MTDEENMATPVKQTLAQDGRIDALVNNVGYSEVGPLEEVTVEEIHRQFETNTFGPLTLAQLVLPTVRTQGSGRIINVSTIGGKIAIPFIGLHNGSKFALEAMSDALRMETRPFGVHVIVVEPGGTRTNFNAVAAETAHRVATDINSPYQRCFELFNRFIGQTEQFNSPPERVAKVIRRALTAKRSRARYAVTSDARIMLAIMPRSSDWKRETLLCVMLGLREERMDSIQL